MLRLVSDENVNDGIVRGLRRREPELDLVSVRDVGLAQTPDPRILEWAAAEGRVIVTEDVNTMVGFAWDRVRAGQPMPGIIALRDGVSVGQAIDELLLMAKCFAPEEVKDQVHFIPL